MYIYVYIHLEGFVMEKKGRIVWILYRSINKDKRSTLVNSESLYLSERFSVVKVYVEEENQDRVFRESFRDSDHRVLRLIFNRRKNPPFVLFVTIKVVRGRSRLPFPYLL